MAEAGQTFQFLRHGYCQSVAEATTRAVDSHAGFRRLPRRTWQFPLRPYDIRLYWGNDLESSQYYKQHFDVPKDQLQNTDNDVTYSVRVVRSPFANEGLCFVGQSTIEGAGLGLFVRARRSKINKGMLSCENICFSSLMLSNVILVQSTCANKNHSTPHILHFGSLLYL